MKATTILFLLLAPSVAVSAQQPPAHVAETYGAPSGDVPAPGLGLVLELVDGRTADARLRLFGGVPGQEATIVVSSIPAEARGPHGETVLVGDPVGTFRGAFDWTGTFEVPLGTSLPAGASLYAQGVHTSAFDLGPGGRPLVQLSNGLVVQGESADEPLWFDDLLPHLPDDVEDLPATTPLAERLQAYLNSAGDSARIQLHLEGNVGAGAYVGAEIDFEVEVERTDDGFYELRIGRDVAGTAGVELAEGCEAGGAAGVGLSEVFRFHSAPGLARGLFGVLAELRFPNLAPGGRIADSGILGDAEDHVQRIQAAVELARESLAAAEELLWGALDQAVAVAAGRRASALSALYQARARLAAARWYERPARAVDVARAAARYAAEHGRYLAALAARQGGERVVETARAQVEARSEELRAALRKRAEVLRVVSALVQVRGYTARHHLGTELRKSVSGSVEAGIPLPVQLANLKAGVEAEAQRTMSALFEPAGADGRFRLTVTREVELGGTAAAAFVAGGEYQRSRTATIVETFELGGGQGVERSLEASIARDVQVRGFAGAQIVAGTGIGRARSIALDCESPLEQVAAFLTGDRAGAMDHVEVGFDLQDRRIRTLEFDLVLSLAGNGGGVEIDVEWADQGRLLSRSWTVGEAFDALLEGADQLPDPAGDTVILN